MKKIVSTRQLILDTLVSNLEHLYTMHERVVPTLPIDEYNDQLLAGIKEAKDTLGNTAQFLQELLDDLNRGIYWYLPKLYVLEKYLSFRHVKPHALDDEVTEELQCSLRRILLEIEGQISHIRTACKWYKNNSDVINHFLPEMDCGRSVQNEIEQHNRKDLRVKRLEKLCTGYLNEIKKDKFLSEVSKTEIIVEEAELEGVEPEEAAFRHYFISDEDGGWTADRKELMSYYIEYGASPETIWYQYQWYKSAWKLQKEIEGQKLTEDKKEDEKNKADDTHTWLADSSIIFNPQVLKTEKDYETVRNIISEHIGETSDENDCAKVNPAAQNELYFIMKGIKETSIVRSTMKNFDFAKQMVEWFPDLFAEKLEDCNKDKDLPRRIAKSISAERKNWKKNGEEVSIRDMSAHANTCEMNSRKKKLCRLASDMKRSIEKWQNTK